jgi:hypothetical protein
MMQNFPISFELTDGTHVLVNRLEEGSYEFHLTRLNSEKHNFYWLSEIDAIEESYETRFDRWQIEAIETFKRMQGSEV